MIYYKTQRLKKYYFKNGTSL